MKAKTNILFIVSGPAAPGVAVEDNPFYFLSEYLSGHVIGSTWSNVTSLQTEKYIESIQHSYGNFRYHAFRRSKLPSFIRHFVHFFQYSKLGFSVLRNNKIDVIVSYGFMVPGLVSALLSRLYSVPLIVEVPGVPDKAIKFSTASFNTLARLLLYFSIRLTLKQAKTVWLLFPNQLSDKFSLKEKLVTVFHEFTPVSLYQPKSVNENIISFLGVPWKLKGVDILIEAFKIISIKYPDARLRIAGYCPDKKPFEMLAGEFRNKIDFLGTMDRATCVDFMTSTKIFVLPSRTEAMGRVLLEAMASEKVVIGSNIDGIPHYINDGETGLLFESENVQDLAAKLDRVLSDQSLAQTLAKNARSEVLKRYTEKHYSQNFDQMIKMTLSDLV